MEISFIHTQISVHLHVNKTNFHVKVFALGLALKQRHKTTRKSPIAFLEPNQAKELVIIGNPVEFKECGSEKVAK